MMCQYFKDEKKITANNGTLVNNKLNAKIRNMLKIQNIKIVLRLLSKNET